MSTTFRVFVVVTGTATNEEDNTLPGKYGFDVVTKNVKSEDMTPDQSATMVEMVLSEFHLRQGIEVLDDFNIVVQTCDGTVLPMLDGKLKIDHDFVEKIVHYGKSVSFAEILGGPQARFSLTPEEWMADAVADPEAYGLSASEVEYYKTELAKTETTENP